MSSKRNCIVSFYHDIEQNFDSDADPEVCRDVVKRFIALESRHGARATYNVVGRLFREQPDLIDWIVAAGHEVAFHSHEHHRDWRPEYYADEVALCRATSERPTGYRSPRSQWGQETLAALWEHGFLWSAENEPHRKEPYFVHKGLVRLPILTDDWPAFTGRQDHDAWVRELETAMATRPYVAIGAHDCVAATDPEAWLTTWERLLKAAAERGALMLSFAETADLYRRGAVARHYDATAKEWNDHSKTLYRSKRFQELIRAEAEKLEQPVVADLASAGGVQSFGLTDVAKHIYCVDNSPGMVASVKANAKLEGRLGELTATSLPDQSIDLVFCVNAIEYLYAAEDLATEIRRIAKPGATCLVAFPALGGCPERPPTSPPDRIQHYFTRDEVLQWGALLGQGRLLGIQYDPSEPITAEREQAYLEMERNPPPDVVPMFWVYVTRVERAPTAPGRRTIPLALCPFAFRAQRFEGLKSAFRSAKKRVPRPLKQAAKALVGRSGRRPAP